MIDTRRCCNDCYNSHGDCIAHGTCLCHAVTVGRLFYGSEAPATDAAALIRTGARYKAPCAACTFEGGRLTTRYPEGAETVRAVQGVAVDGCVVTVVVGEAAP